MPVRNAYNEKIGNTVLRMNQHYLNHLAEYHMVPHIDSVAPMGNLWNDDADGNKLIRNSHLDQGYEYVEPKFKRTKGELHGNGILDDVLEVAPLIAMGKKPRAKRAPKMDGKGLIPNPKNNVGVNMHGVQGQGIGDVIGNVVKRGARTIKAFSKILQNKGDANDFLNTISLGKYGDKKQGGNKVSSVVDSKGETFVTPQEQVDRIIKNGGAKKYIKKGLKGGNIDRLIGGDKLKLRQEMPPSQMIGFGGKKVNAWQETIQKVKKAHPELKGLKAITKYIKDNNLYKKQ